MKKKIYSLLLLLCLPLVASAQMFNIGNLWYVLDSTGAVVISKGDGTKYAGEITIPESVIYEEELYSVRSIDDWAFYDCPNLIEVKILGSVETIGSGAFQNCLNLTSIEIPSSVKSIAYNAFYSCPRLTNIVVDEDNTYYDSRGNCNAIIETTSNTLILGCNNTIIPSSVTSIGDYAFYECSSLTSVEIPNSMTSIGEYAFYKCSGLTRIIIPNSVTTIGTAAFSGCSGLTEVTLSNNLKSIEGYVFTLCI